MLKHSISVSSNSKLEVVLDSIKVFNDEMKAKYPHLGEKPLIQLDKNTIIDLDWTGCYYQGESPEISFIFYYDDPSPKNKAKSK